MEVLYRWGKSKVHRLSYCVLNTTACGKPIPRDVEKMDFAKATEFIMRPTSEDRKNACGSCFRCFRV